jgi:septum formation protein
MTAPLVLASASPRRKELIALLGHPFEVVPSRYDEPPPPTTPVSLPDLVSTLAREKAMETASRLADASRLIIGADTLVTLSADPIGLPLGKPTDAEDAFRMLHSLAGSTHTVYTGVCIVRFSPENSKAEVLASGVESTRVTFRELDDRVIWDYIATQEPMDKAGAYGAQGYAAPFIESFAGDFYNVVGLPLCLTGKLLENAGFNWWQHRTVMPDVIG